MPLLERLPKQGSEGKGRKRRSTRIILALAKQMFGRKQESEACVFLKNKNGLILVEKESGCGVPFSIKGIKAIKTNDVFFK